MSHRVKHRPPRTRALSRSSSTVDQHGYYLPVGLHDKAGDHRGSQADWNSLRVSAVGVHPLSGAGPPRQPLPVAATVVDPFRRVIRSHTLREKRQVKGMNRKRGHMAVTSAGPQLDGKSRTLEGQAADLPSLALVSACPVWSRGTPFIPGCVTACTRKPGSCGRVPLRP
jgi:hypothetical protein